MRRRRVDEDVERRQSVWAIVFLVSAVLAVVIGMIMWPAAVAAPTPEPVDAAPNADAAQEPTVTPDAGPPPLDMTLLPTCEPEGAQDFLIRENYIGKRRSVQKAVDWRVEKYLPQIKPTTFFGITIVLHEKTHAPLRCVEEWIEKNCEDDYRPKNLSGWRARHTYKGDEVSNHVMGIAIDVDPALNSCCGCAGHWANSPLCEYTEEGMGAYALPNCWVRAFEKHGWYWLGCDPQLRDTMHFEYLAEPGGGCDG
jgi:hypothetical protein